MYGTVFNNQLDRINNGGTHESNPMGGVPMYEDENNQDLVEEGEVVYGDYVFSNRLKPDEEWVKYYRIPSKYTTFAEIAEYFANQCEKEGSSPAGIMTLETNIRRLVQHQELKRQQEYERQAREFYESLTPEEQEELMAMAQQQQEQEEAGVDEADAQEAMQMQESGQLPEQQQEQQTFSFGGSMKNKTCHGFGDFINAVGKAGGVVSDANTILNSLNQYAPYNVDYNRSASLAGKVIGGYQHINAPIISDRINYEEKDFRGIQGDIRAAYMRSLDEIESDDRLSSSQKRLQKQKLLSQLSSDLAKAESAGIEANNQARVAVAAQNADIAKTNAQNIMQANATNANNWKDVNNTAAQIYLNDVTAQEGLKYKYDIFNEQTAYKAKTDFKAALARYESKLKDKQISRDLGYQYDNQRGLVENSFRLLTDYDGVLTEEEKKFLNEVRNYKGAWLQSDTIHETAERIKNINSRISKVKKLRDEEEEKMKQQGVFGGGSSNE